MEQTNTNMDKEIKQILEKKIDLITAEEVCELDAWLTEAAGHDCTDPMRHCEFCFYAVKAAKKLGDIEKLDEAREHDIDIVMQEIAEEDKQNELLELRLLIT